MNNNIENMEIELNAIPVVTEHKFLNEEIVFVFGAEELTKKQIRGFANLGFDRVVLADWPTDRSLQMKVLRDVETCNSFASLDPFIIHEIQFMDDFFVGSEGINVFEWSKDQWKKAVKSV